MGATFERLKNWAREILTNEDLNAEIDNILENLVPDGIDGYSDSVAQMRVMTDPGETGSESQADSLAGEIERIRFMLKSILGDNSQNWYDVPALSLSSVASVLGSDSISNRIISGRTTGNSKQLDVLRAGGTTRDLTLLADQVPYSYIINNVQYSVEDDLVIENLGLAPSTDNTLTIDDSEADGSQGTKAFGQFGHTIVVDNMDAEIVSRIGSIQAFKVNATGEILMAFVRSSTSLVSAMRGVFWDDDGLRVPADELNDNDTLTLLQLTWIFLRADGTLGLTYRNPSFSSTEPSTPAVGDYWFDIVAREWRVFDSVAWQPTLAVLVGVSVQDDSNCIATRSFDVAIAASDYSSLQLDAGTGNFTDDLVRARTFGSEISVFGDLFRYAWSRPSWNFNFHLATGVTRATETFYFCYVDNSGRTLISDVIPLERSELRGFYHPHETWRCVGYFLTDDTGSGNIIAPIQTIRSADDMSALVINIPAQFVYANSASGDTSTTSTSAVNIANQTLTIESTGNPIAVGVNAAGVSQGILYLTSSTTGLARGVISIVHNGVTLRSVTLLLDAKVIDQAIGYPATMISFFLNLPAGTHTLTLQWFVNAGTTTLSTTSGGAPGNGIQMYAYEVGSR